MIVYAGVFVVAMLLGRLVYRYDLYDKEPWYLLLLATSLGAITGSWSGNAQESLINGMGVSWDDTFGLSVLAGVIEEAAKLLVVVAIALVFRQQFNDPQDGQIYGAFVGIGAALIESFYYVRLTDNPLQSISTEFARLVLHMLLGGLAGFGVGLAACRVAGWRWKLPTAFATAATLHFLWDWQCGIPAMMGPASLISRLFAVGLMITAMALFGVITLAGAGQSAIKFKATKLKQLWGWPFNRFLRRPK